MSSINTNTSAMNALATLRNVNSNLNQTQDRISTGLKVSSGKDNAAYFAISETMKGDSGMTKAVNESLTLTKNSVATARLGAEQFSALATEFRDKVAFAQENKGGLDEIESDLKRLAADMGAILNQSTFNGDDLVNKSANDLTKPVDGNHYYAKEDDGNNTLEYATKVASDEPDDADTAATVVSDTDLEAGTHAVNREVVTGVSRSSGGDLALTKITVEGADLSSSLQYFEAIANEFAHGAKDADHGDDFLEAVLGVADKHAKHAINEETKLGQSEKSIERQQEFLTKLSDNLDSGVGVMVDANMEEEAARLQALQVQQQLASQSLSIANQAPQNILSLFR